MARRLTSYVHVVDADGRDVAFGPDDKVPGWAAKQIVNPKAWADPHADEGDDGTAATSGASGSSTVPDGGGTGNGPDGEPPRADGKGMPCPPSLPHSMSLRRGVP
jgi:hypothetical protein